MLAARKGKLLVGNVFVVLVCVCVRLREVCLIDAASALHLYPAYSELVKFRKNESEKKKKTQREKERLREEIWWQITVRRARTSKPGLGVLWWRGCELPVNVKLSKWKSIMCVCQCLTSERCQRTTASRAERWARKCMCVCVRLCVFGVMALNRRITGLQAQSSNISHVVWELSFCITSYVLINIWMPEPKGSRFARVFVCTDLHTSVCIIEAQFNLSLAHTLASWEIYFVGHGWAPSHLSASVELFHPTGN